MAGPGPNYHLYQAEHRSVYLIYKTNDDNGVDFLTDMGAIVARVEHYRDEDGGNHGHVLFTADDEILPRDLRRIFWNNQPSPANVDGCNHGSLGDGDRIRCPSCESYLKIIPIRDPDHFQNVQNFIGKIQDNPEMNCDPR